MDFVQSMNDQCLLMRNDQIRTIIICLYIDDTLCVGDKKALEAFKKEIKKYFVTEEEGKVEDYVGCMIKKINGGVLLHQSDLIKKIKLQLDQEIKDMRDYRTPGAPGEGSIRVKDDDVCISEQKQFKYRSAVGMMLFLIKYSRPNISNAGNCLNQRTKQTTHTTNNATSTKYQKSNVEVYAYIRKG